MSSADFLQVHTAKKTENTPSDQLIRTNKVPNRRQNTANSSITQSDDQLAQSMRKLMKLNLKNLCYSDAIFYASKALNILHHQTTKSPRFVQAVYDLAYCYLQNKEEQRCVQLVEKFELAYHSTKFRVLTAQALFNSGNIVTCISVLEKQVDLESEDVADPSFMTDRSNLQSPPRDENESYYRGLRCLLIAKAYEVQENKEYAVQFYKEALLCNPECHEAFDRLVRNFLLTQQEKVELVKELSFNNHNHWLKDYYLSRIDQQLLDTNQMEGVVKVRQSSGDGFTDQQAAADESGLPRFQCSDDAESLRAPQANNLTDSAASNLNTTKRNSEPQGVDCRVIQVLQQREDFDIRQIQAEKSFNDQNFAKAYELLKSMVDEDSYFVRIVPLFCSVLTELQKVGELYYLAHKLVSANPDLPAAWFTVGCYYFLIKKFDLARKYFNKAKNMDKNFAASWIAFGHSFAAQDESEQAMAAYRSAARLFPGCHLANLFIGMEYLRTNNLQIAMMSFEQAKTICDRDPRVFNELGVVQYRQRMYQDAEESLGIALSLCCDSNSDTYETILVNLAHCKRKLGDLDAAIVLYHQCLSISPKNAATYTALGYAYHLKFDLRQALHYYHKAHFLKNDDPMIEDLVQKAIDDINSTDVFPIEQTYLK